MLLLAGHLSFKLSPKGRYRDSGASASVSGLTLVGPPMLVETFRPVETAPVLGKYPAALTADPILDMLLAAALTFRRGTQASPSFCCWPVCPLAAS